MSSDILPPISEVTSTDHGAFVLITNGFGLCLVLIFTIIRVFARLFINPPFDRDDLLMGVATLLAIIYSALLFSLVSKGFGRAQDLLSPAALVTVQKLLYASDFFFLFTVWASKCSMALLFTRLTPRADQKRLALGLRITVTVWLVLSVFLIALQCNLSRPWIFMDPQCRDAIVRWDIIGAIDIATEVALFGMAILLVKDLKMDVSKKSFVVVAFALRLPMIAFTILRLQTAKTWLGSSDLSLNGVFFVIWSIVEAHFSICSSNIACLKPFIAAFNTSFGGSAEINELSRMDRSGGHSNSGTLNPIKNFSRRHRADKNASNVLSSSSNNDPNSSKTPPAKGDLRSQLGDRGTGHHRGSGGRTLELGNEVDIIHEDTGSIGSGGSRQMIIQKDVTWDVEYSTPSINKPVKGRLRGGGGGGGGSGAV
ncbi:MAG: hypothetical protein L6R36_001637 [Xanthoria steineri]|nr:MAG: hypothetical protein L6R36_001637 [Xanthoria steineri]